MAKGAPTVAKEISAPARVGKGLRSSDIRLRAFIVGLAIIPFDNYWVLYMEKVRTGPYPTTLSIFANVVFILAALALVNVGLKRIHPKAAFSTAEMLLIYSMTAVSCALAGHDMMPTLVGMMVHPWEFATPENAWATTFMPHLPTWLCVPGDSLVRKEAIKCLSEGHSSLYTTGYWLLWLKPCLWWLSFITALVFVMMCINTLIRKQWTDRERLTFPLVHLPVAMTEPKGEIWRSKLFWIGFGIAFGIDLWNGFSAYYPALPQINVGFQNHDLGLGLIDKPWSAIGWLPYTFYPMVIGIGYLLPTDLSFSCWFFYLFWKVEKIVATMAGWETIPGFPYESFQVFGGFLAIILTMAWTSRSYLKQVWLRTLGRPSELDDSDEPMSYRAAVLGALVGFAYLAIFMKAIGMSPLLAVAVFVIYFVLAIGIGRIRAECGPPIHDLHFTGPDALLTTGVGTGHMTNGDLVGMSYLWWFNRAYRAHPMPIVTESLKMADTARASQRKFFWGIMLAVVVGVIATFWCYLHVGYKLGFSSGVSQGGVYASGQTRRLSEWWMRSSDALQPDWGSNLGMLVGFVFCTFLSYMRLHIVNWPFHPIGYVISASYQINLVWVPLLISWAIKVCLLKFGGLKLYKTAVPLFLGLILGAMVIGCIWSLIGICFNMPYYSFWGQ